MSHRLDKRRTRVSLETRVRRRLRTDILCDPAVKGRRESPAKSEKSDRRGFFCLLIAMEQI